MPLFQVPDSVFFRTDNSSRLIAGFFVVVIAHLSAYSLRYRAGKARQRIHGRSGGERSRPSTRSMASALRWESME